MREILFRGKRVNNGEWVEGAYLGDYFSDGRLFCIRRNSINYCIDPATVGQYTGLQDKNGNKIFEGDIVKYIPDDEDEVGVDFYLIEFCNGSYRIGRDVISQDYADEWEVAGNVHDNPELLEVK